MAECCCRKKRKAIAVEPTFMYSQKLTWLTLQILVLQTRNQFPVPLTLTQNLAVNVKSRCSSCSFDVYAFHSHFSFLCVQCKAMSECVCFSVYYICTVKELLMFIILFIKICPHCTQFFVLHVVLIIIIELFMPQCNFFVTNCDCRSVLYMENGPLNHCPQACA